MAAVFVEVGCSVVRYICHFLFRDAWNAVESEEGIGRFDGGFWVTGTMELTKGSNCKYWIAPSQIKYIEKIGGR